MKRKLSLLAICLILIAPMLLSSCKEPEAPANDTPADNSLSIDGTWIFSENYEAGEREEGFPAYSYERFKMEIKGNTCKIYERGEKGTEKEAFYNAIKNGEPVPESKWKSFPMYEGIITIDEEEVSYQVLFINNYYDPTYDLEKEGQELSFYGNISKDLNKIIFNQVNEDGKISDLEQYLIFIKQ